MSVPAAALEVGNSPFSHLVCLWAVTMARECCGSSPGAEMPAWQTQARQAGRWAVSSLDCPRGSPSHPSAGGRAFPPEECRRSSPDWLALVGAGGRQFSVGGVAVRAAQRLGWPRGSPASAWHPLVADPAWIARWVASRIAALLCCVGLLGSGLAMGAQVRGSCSSCSPAPSQRASAPLAPILSSSAYHGRYIWVTWRCWRGPLG